jgi:serine/threonine protein kinase
VILFSDDEPRQKLEFSKSLCSTYLIFLFSSQVKIVDFGLARQIPDAEFELKVICGTAEFMAPEVLNFDPVTFKSDIW